MLDKKCLFGIIAIYITKGKIHAANYLKIATINHHKPNVKSITLSPLSIKSFSLDECTWIYVFHFQPGQPKVDVCHLTALIDNPFVILTYKEAMDVLEKNSGRVRRDVWIQYNFCKTILTFYTCQFWYFHLRWHDIMWTGMNYPSILL